MRYRAIRVGVALAVVLTGCEEKVATMADVGLTEADSVGVRMVTISGSVDALPEWSLAEKPLTEISGNAPPYLGSVGEVAFLGDDNLLIYDRQTAELRSFASDGRVLRLLARAGDGPGELRALVRLTVTTGDTIYAFDARHSQVSVFGPDGSFLTTIPVDRNFSGLGTSAWALGSHRFLLYGVEPGEPDSPEDLPHRVVRERVMQVVSDQGTELGPSIHFTGGFSVRGASGVVGSPFSNRPFASVNAGRILHGSGLMYELVIRDFELRPLSVIRWPGWQHPITTSMLGELRDPMEASLSELRSVNPEAADQLMETLLHPDALPEVLPALGSALLDENGRIWVSRFQPAQDLRVATTGGYEPWHEEDAWHVLAQDGTPIARVRLPSETRLLAVRGDRVAVVSRDSLGVEHVQVLAIIASGRHADSP